MKPLMRNDLVRFDSLNAGSEIDNQYKKVSRHQFTAIYSMKTSVSQVK